jgi:hypothetical protein
VGPEAFNPLANERFLRALRVFKFFLSVVREGLKFSFGSAVKFGAGFQVRTLNSEA